MKIVCKKCEGQPFVHILKEIKTKQQKILQLGCGHYITKQVTQVLGKDTASKIKPENSITNDLIKPFQAEAIEFIEKSDFNCIIADEMGLGKTIEILAALKLHPEMFPILILCKSSLKMQWFKEVYKWLGIQYLPQTIESAREKAYPEFKIFIMSMDLLKNFDLYDDTENPFKNVKIKTLIIDECQQIKNSDSQRTQQVKTLRKQLEIEHIIPMSGTPIKNHAGEYFTILNLVKPEKFPTYQSFLNNHVQTYHTAFSQKAGALKFPSQFKELTKDFIIRRERSDVLPDLPQVTRNYKYCELGQAVEKAYKNAFIEFKQYMDSDQSYSFQSYSNKLQYLTRMRHLTGIAKIDPTIDFVQEFLETTDRKMTIFLHHKDVGQTVFSKLTDLLNYEPLMLVSELDTEQRYNLVENFKNNGHRVMIASTLASGEGLNLQFCSDCVIMERQWNPANEEQVESRFIRIGQLSDKVTATYFVAVGTVDEFFAELVEKKREIIQQAMKGNPNAVISYQETSLMKELMEILASKGGKKWLLS